MDTKTCTRCNHSFTSTRYKYCDRCREWNRARWHNTERPAKQRRIYAKAVVPFHQPAECCPDCQKPLTLYRAWNEANGADEWYCHRCKSAKQPAGDAK
jgi:hypothetical protein